MARSAFGAGKPTIFDFTPTANTTKVDHHSEQRDNKFHLHVPNLALGQAYQFELSHTLSDTETTLPNVGEDDDSDEHWGPWGDSLTVVTRKSLVRK